MLVGYGGLAAIANQHTKQFCCDAAEKGFANEDHTLACAGFV
jgi:hypothetical protein